MQGNQHIINKISVQLNGVPVAEAFQWQQQLAAFLQQQLPARLEKIFDEACSPAEWMHIDKLQVQFSATGNFSMMQLEQRLTESIDAQLKKNRSKKAEPGKAKAHSPIQAWLYFLQLGSLPWWAPTTSLRKLEAFVLKELHTTYSTTSSQVRNALQNPLACQRLVLQSSDDMFVAVLELLGLSKAERAKAENAFRQRIKSLDRPVERSLSTIVRYVVLQTAVGGNNNKKDLQERVEKYISTLQSTRELSIEKLVASIREKQDEDPQQEQDVSAEKIFAVKNAGLVLLHPFLYYFFDELHLLDAEKKSIAHPGKALQLLHYLATGEAECSESETVVGKVLCGLEIGSPVYTAHEISAAEKAECQNLLEAVIKNWPALKNTSVDGLRETFLQRTGKLNRKRDHWLLQVEQKTVDILLNNLQWPLSIVRLPWMKDWLQVEWG